jgi:hypothetical protein
MPRVLGLGVLLASSAAAAEPPLASTYALPRAVAMPSPAPPVRFQFESPGVDYSHPARPERKLGFLAAVEVAPNGFLGIGLSNRKALRSSFGPDEGREARRGGKKLAIRYVLSF